MKILNPKFAFAGILLAGTMLLGLANSANALDISLQSVRVQLPNGQVLSINDGNNWYHDQRVAAYKRYYYDPNRRVYVVYNEDHPPRGWQRYHPHDMGYRHQPGRGRHAPAPNPQPHHGPNGHDDHGPGDHDDDHRDNGHGHR